MASSTVPQAEITNALLICAKACEYPYSNPATHRIATRWKVIGPTHHVNARTLRDQREHRERIGILAANQAAHRPKCALERAESVAMAAGMDEPLADGRHDLLMLANERAVRADIKLGVEQGADGVRNFFAQPHDDIGAGVLRRGAQRRGFDPGNFNCVLEKLDRKPVGDRPGRDMVMVPDRVRRNPSGKPITRAPLRPASRMRLHALSIDPARSRNTEAACTAATFTVSYLSPMAPRLARAGTVN